MSSHDILAAGRRLTLLALLLALLGASTARAYEEMTVAVGEQRVVTVPAGSDITFTGPLRIVRMDRNRVKIIGDAPGWGSVTVQRGDDFVQYSVTVVEVPPEQTIARLRSLLKELDLKYSVAGGKVVLEGRVENAPDLERFNRVLDMFPGVISMVHIAATEPLIDIAVTLVEVDASRSSGLALLDITPPAGQATLTGRFPLSDIINGTVSASGIDVGFALSTQLLSALSAEIASGRARIVANPRIVTLSRRQAVITSGGEIPYRVVGANGAQGVEYKPYGIRLTVTPEERANDVVLELNLESSEPVGAVSGSSENALTSRSIDMTIAVAKDKTLAIAGLYNAVTSRAARNGCLFPLFSTAAATRSREIIVLITPRVTVDGIQPDCFRMITPRDLNR